MNFSQVSQKIAVLLAAVTVGATLTLAVPMAYASSGAHMKAELAQPLAEKSSKIIRGAMVKCEGNRCASARINSSAINSCILVAREFGAVVAFKVGNRQLTSEELAKCNSDDRVQAAMKATGQIAAK